MDMDNNEAQLTQQTNCGDNGEGDASKNDQQNQKENQDNDKGDKEKDKQDNGK